MGSRQLSHPLCPHAVCLLSPLQSAGCDVTVYQNERSLGIEVRLPAP